MTWNGEVKRILTLKIADTLNKLDGFNLTDRAVRDKITGLIKKFRPLINKSIQDTGLGGDEPTEHEVLVQEVEFLREKMKCDQENRQKDRELQVNQTNMQNQLLANLLQSNQQMMAQQTFLMQELLKHQKKD